MRRKYVLCAILFTALAFAFCTPASAEIIKGQDEGKYVMYSVNYDGNNFLNMQVWKVGTSPTGRKDEFAQRKITATDIEGLDKGLKYIYDLLGKPKGKESSVIDFVLQDKKNSSAHAESPIMNDNSSTWFSAYYAGAGRDTAVDPNRADAIVGVSTTPTYIQWYADKFPLIPSNGLDQSYPSIIVHELGHAMGILAKLSPELMWKGTAKFDNDSKFNTGLRDIYGTAAKKDMEIVELAAGENPAEHSADKFYVYATNKDGTATVSQSGMYFTGTNVAEVLTVDGKTAQLAWDDDSEAKAVPGLPVMYYDAEKKINNKLERDASHIELQNCLMSHQLYRNYNTFTEAELALLQDVGNTGIDRRKFYGFSVYNSGTSSDDRFEFENDNPYYARKANGSGWDGTNPSKQALGTGFHLYGSHTDVTQTANLLADGDYSIGARIDGCDNFYTIDSGAKVTANGLEGSALAVCYGKKHEIIHRGTLEATGEGGIAARFDFGSNELSDDTEYRGSYIYSKYNTVAGQFVNANGKYANMPSALKGELVTNFDVTGRLEGKKAAIYVSPNALVKNINIMDGAKITGDIISDWNVAGAAANSKYKGVVPQYDDLNTGTTQLTFGLKANSDGRVTKVADNNFKMDYNGNITMPYSTYMTVAGGQLNFSGNKAELLGVKVAENATLTGSANYMLYSHDKLTDSGWFINNGTFAPVNSANGAVTIEGNYSQGGTLDLAQGNTLEVTGTAQMLGKVDLHGAGQVKAVKAGTVLFPVDNIKNGEDPLTVENGTLDLDGQKIALQESVENTAGAHIVFAKGVAGIEGTKSNPKWLQSGTRLDGLRRRFYGYETYLENVTFAGNSNGYHVASERSKSLSEGTMAGVASLNEANDLAANAAIEAANDISASGEFEAFAAMQGSHGRYKTGSYVDLNGFNVAAGLAKRTGTGTVLGLLIEGGTGRYDAFNETFSGNVNAKGDISYFGAGVFARHDFNQSAKGNAYLDGSFRAGHSNRDYSSENVTLDGTTRYSAGSSYLAAHATAGYKWKFADAYGLDAYVKYLYARQGSDSVNIDGENIDFDSVNSNRLRTGFRFSKQFDEAVKGYAGLAWEYEFTAEANAIMSGTMAIDAPDLKGGSGMAELGVQYAPKKANGWKFGAAVQGFTGKRDSVVGKLMLTHEFGGKK